MRNTFIVGTENYVTKIVARKALKAADNNVITHNLLRKASMNGNKIVIPTTSELTAWRNAIEAYKPANAQEAKVCKALVFAATRGCKKRDTITA